MSTPEPPHESKPDRTAELAQAAGSANPPGYTFYDNRSMLTMRLVSDGPWKDWIVYKHPDGQWVTLRKAMAVDWQVLAEAMSATIHAPHSPNEKDQTPRAND